MSKIKIPCEDCLLLPICIQRFNSTETFKIENIEDECDIIDNYTTDHDLTERFGHKYSDNHRSIEVINFYSRFGLHEQKQQE